MGREMAGGWAEADEGDDSGEWEEEPTVVERHLTMAELIGLAAEEHATRRAPGGEPGTSTAFL